MILQQVTITVSDGQETAFEGALIDVRQRLFMAAGFRGFSVAQSADDPAIYLVQVRWETADEVIAFFEAGGMDRAWEPAKPFFSGRMRAEHYVERDGLAFVGPGTADDLTAALDG